MSSLKLGAPQNSEASLRRSLKNWGKRQHPPKNIRFALLNKAAADSQGLARRRLWKHTLQRWVGDPALNASNLKYADLSRWLFSQAMLQNLRIDRHALRTIS